MTAEVTLEAIRPLVTNLSPADKLRLISDLTLQLLEQTAAPDAPDSWNEFLALGDELATLRPTAADSADILSAMRR